MGSMHEQRDVVCIGGVGGVKWKGVSMRMER